MNYILALDQGTSSSRAIIFNQKGDTLATAKYEITQYYPHNGWVEHQPEEIWQSTLKAIKSVLEQLQLTAKDILCCGITNQRETIICWNKDTGEVAYNAIVWQDRRTEEICKKYRQDNQFIQATTGLYPDPYFSATKLKWLIENVKQVRDWYKQEKLAVGTVDSFLIWRFNKGTKHLTDTTNASRTLLFNIHDRCWDQKLLDLFSIRRDILPSVKPCDADFGEIDANYFGSAIKITAVAGDQHAAMIGQGCIQQGMVKSTYGTGCFLMMNIGPKFVLSENRLLTTIAYHTRDAFAYGIEGSIFNAGTTVKWLRDELQLIEHAHETEALASACQDNGGVYMVPAFTGLGAPYWDPSARGAIFGLQRDTSIAQITRAALESVCYQTQDILLSMASDCNQLIQVLQVDGGMTSNNWLLQFLSDITRTVVQRGKTKETTALGVALLAGLGSGLYHSLEDLSFIQGGCEVFSPALNKCAADGLYLQWKNAVDRVCSV